MINRLYLDSLVDPSACQGVEALVGATLNGYSDPDIIYFVSGSEHHGLNVGVGRRVITHLLERFPNAEAKVVHLGCIGVFAAMADFKSSCGTSAFVVCDESCEALSQRCLSVAGVGLGSPGGGLLAKAGMRTAMLSKSGEGRSGSIEVTDLRIYAQAPGIEGTRKLLNTMRAAYQSLEDARIPVVSFAIDTPWCHALLKDLQPKAGDMQWLPSAEQDRNHLMSLKPMIEIEKYREYVERSSLAIVTLGLGGRVGIMRAGITNMEPALSDEHVFWPISLPAPELSSLEPDFVAPYRLKSLFSLDRTYKARDGLYFTSAIRGKNSVDTDFVSSFAARPGLASQGEDLWT